MGRTPPPRYGMPLTERERTILRHMAHGLLNKEIGSRLFVSEDTIKTHARRMFVKLGVAGRMDAVMVGIAMGIVPCPCRKAVAS